MKKVLYIIIPIIVLLTIMLIIIFLPKEKEELKKINNISHFSFYYSQGYAINSDIRYYIDVFDIGDSYFIPTIGYRLKF